MLLGSVEAGGTKFVCAVGDENFKVQDMINFPTTTPEETLQKVVSYFKKFELDAIGIASFGPIEIHQDNPYYGFITTTPKPGWENTDFVGFLQKELAVPISWTTDVNGSAYGEYITALKTNKEVNALTYYTVGTGVGAGTVINDEFVGTLSHPEMGHVLVKRHPADLNFAGICPYHQDCLEGLVAGPTFEARLGISGKDVPLDHPVWDIMAYYVAQAALQTTLTLRPNKIVFGGGVISEPFLIKVRQQLKELVNGYISLPAIDEYLVQPQIDNNGSATVGNFALAAELMTK